MDGHVPERNAYDDMLRQSPYSLLLVPFAAVGLLYVGTIVFSYVRLIFSLFVLPGKSLRSFGPKGSWALITGASDGLGLEFATQLARAHYNVVLVSRTASKLEALSQDLTSKYNVQAKTLAIDFANSSPSDYDTLKSLASELDIAILVNNVGKSHDIPVPFALTSPEEMHDIIEINCMATLKVTSLVLPGMQSRRRGLILTMGSFAGLMPTPLLATYSGSKAFLQQWSTALGAEVAAQNITVELVQSYLVASAMSKIRRATATIPTPRVFVRAVLGKVGRSGGAQSFAYTSTPFWSHAIMQWALTNFVGLYNGTAVGQNKVMHESIRMRALKKRARDSGKKAA